MKVKFKKLFKPFIMGWIVIILISGISWSQTDSAIGTGKVIRGNNGETFYLKVRETPPFYIPNVSYKAGKDICTVISGAEFKYFETKPIGNGEEWYRVEFTNADKFSSPDPEDSCQKNQKGWMIGTFSNGRSFITTENTASFLSLTEDSQQPPDTLSPVTEDSQRTQETQDTPNTHPKFPWTSLLIFICGGVIGLLILVFEQESKAYMENEQNNISFWKLYAKKIFSGIFLVRVLVLISSMIFCFLIILGTKIELVKMPADLLLADTFTFQSDILTGLLKLSCGLFVSIFILKYISFGD